MDARERDRFADAIRRTIIEQSYRANVGHIGSALSIADLVAAVIGGPARLDGGADRDRFVLSKGHAALALYAALHLDGRLERGRDRHLLRRRHACSASTPSTGSTASTSAPARSARASRSAPARRSPPSARAPTRRVFVIMSDAELNEGSVWEAAMFAAQHRLDNLTLLIDLNGQQALGYTRDVLDLGAVEEKLAQFGWSAEARRRPRPGGARQRRSSRRPEDGRGRSSPRTTFGYGVSFMESQIKWHYLPLDDESYAAALAELERGRPA